MAKKPTAKDLLFLLDDRLEVNLKPGEGVEKAKERLEKRLKEGKEDLVLLKRAISIYDALFSLGMASKEALAANLLEHIPITTTSVYRSRRSSGKSKSMKTRYTSRMPSSA